MLLLLTSLALAHIPHDVVHSAAIPPDFDESVPWFVIQDIEAQNDLYRSDDGGQTWNAIQSDILIDKLTDAAYTTSGVAAFLGEGRYWYTNDGDTWYSKTISVPVTKMAAYGRYLYFVGIGGIYRAAPGGVMTANLAGVPANGLFTTPDGLIATMTDGSIYRLQRGSWTHISGPSSATPLSGTADSSRIYLGYADGTVWRYDGSSWDTCGVDPYAAYNLDRNQVVALSTDGSTLMMARADIGPAVSTDGCDSWSENVAPMNIDWPEDPGGSSATTASAFTVLIVSGSRAFIGGYDGLADQQGGEWEHLTLKGGDYTRGIAFSHNFASDGIAFAGAYGSGVAVTHDGGATWDAPAMGITAPNVENVLIPPDALAAERVYALFDRVPHVSTDQGASWTEVVGPFTQSWDIALGPNDRVWALGLDTADSFDGGVVLSTDGGATWNELTTWPASIGTETVRGVVDAYPRLWAWTQTHVLRSVNGGTSWTDVYTSSSDITDLVGLPADRPTEVVLANADGLILWSRGSATQVYDDDDAEVFELAIADDGTIVAGDQMERILRSDDSGRSFYDTGARVTNQFYRLETHPDFGSHPQIFAAGSDGAFIAEDADVQRWSAYQRVDDATDYVYCSSCTIVNDATSALGRHTQLSTGNSMWLTMRGDTVRVIGASGRRSFGKLFIDGVQAATFNLPITPRGSVIVEATGLTEDWHHVEILLQSGSLTVDAFEALGTSHPAGGWASGPTAPPTGAYDDGDAEAGTGCASTGATRGSWMALALAGLAASRRSRGSRR